MKFADQSSLGFWNRLPATQRARTLALDRFASFPLNAQNGRYFLDRANTGYRRETSVAVANGAVLRDGASAWVRFLRESLRLPDEQIVFAQLQSRLMVNMAGGVLENGGLCLDRRSGLPFVPGSAVKGCARRMAVQELVAAREDGRPVAELAEKLVLIALVFGWGDTDWKSGRKPGWNGRDGEFYSDFEYACGSGESWRAVRRLVAARLLHELGVKQGSYPDQPWDDLPNFAGIASFLPAYPMDVAGAELPVRLPTLGTLELDVVTCHHPAYYRGDEAKPVATDDEDPNPVVFPAVASGHVFAFALTPLRACSIGHLKHARQWLTDGLATFGIGAKTAAGYGWFDTSPAIGQAVLRQLRNRAEAERKEREVQTEKERQREAEEMRRKAREEVEKATANMSDGEKLLYALKQLTGPQFLSKLDRWKDLAPAERVAIYDLMRSDKASLWLDLRKKATEGKQKEKARWGQLVQDLFKLAKDRKEKMPS